MSFAFRRKILSGSRARGRKRRRRGKGVKRPEEWKRSKRSNRSGKKRSKKADKIRSKRDNRKRSKEFDTRRSKKFGRDLRLPTTTADASGSTETTKTTRVGNSSDVARRNGAGTRKPETTRYLVILDLLKRKALQSQ